jgi:hypothetical protein
MAPGLQSFSHVFVSTVSLLAGIFLKILTRDLSFLCRVLCLHSLCPWLFRPQSFCLQLCHCVCSQFYCPFQVILSIADLSLN